MGFFLRDAIDSECLDIFPRGLPDEALESLMARFSVVNNINSRFVLYRKLFGRACVHNRFFTEDLWALSQRVVGVDSSWFYNEYLKNHTYHSLIKNFRGVNENDTVLRNNDLIGLLSRSVRVCPTCMNEDIESIGVPYFRRSHNIGGVSCCWKHSISLQTIDFGSRDFSEDKKFFVGGYKHIFGNCDIESGEKEEVQYARFLTAVVGLKVLNKDLLNLCLEGRAFEIDSYERQSWLWDVRRNGYSLRSLYNVFGSAKILEVFESVQ